MLSRRNLLRFAAAGVAGLLLPKEVAAEPDRRIFALDKTMISPTEKYWDYDPDPGYHYAYTSGWFDSRMIPPKTYNYYVTINGYQYPVASVSVDANKPDRFQSSVVFDDYSRVDIGAGRVFINGEEVQSMGAHPGERIAVATPMGRDFQEEVIRLSTGPIGDWPFPFTMGDNS